MWFASPWVLSYLYKRSNRVWHRLIRAGLTHAVWWPLIELSRRRHLAFRRRLARTTAVGGREPRGGTVVAPGV
jgi:hypothetical protein